MNKINRSTLVEAITALQSENAELKRQLEGARKGWQPIETAPKDGCEFVACNMNQGGVMQLVSWNGLHRFWQSKGEPVFMQATHWMPLPPPPQLGEQNEQD
jgi:hypothetical protein